MTKIPHNAKLQAQLQRIHSSQSKVTSKTTHIFQNHRNHEYTLAKESLCGKKVLRPKETFKGDDYFITFVRLGELKILETFEAPAVNTTETLNESNTQGAPMEKLILDQPNKVTTQGTVEHVVSEQPKAVKVQNINDANQNGLEEDVLLVENPMAGIDIVK